MFGVLSIAVVAALVMLWRETSADDQPSKMSSQLEKLWNISLGALREKKYLRAEKALLTEDAVLADALPSFHASPLRLHEPSAAAE